MMDLQSFLEYVNSGKRIQGQSEEIAFCGYLTQEALKITGVINTGYHSPEELQELFSQLTGQPINRTLGLIPPFHTDCGKNIHIGEGVFLNAGCTFQDTGGIWIGDGCLIGHHATIATLNHDNIPSRRHDLLPSPVKIGKNVWLGANVTVCPGVTIGDHAIVAAGAVVTRDVKPNTIVAGVPARFLKRIEETD